MKNNNINKKNINNIHKNDGCNTIEKKTIKNGI